MRPCYSRRMAVVLDFIKAYLIPGSTWLLIIGTLVALAMLLRPAGVRWARRVLLLLLLAYVILSMPLVAGCLTHGTLGSGPTVSRADQALGVRTIVVLGNGVITFGPPGRWLHLPRRNTTHNLLEGVRLYRLLADARIIASGGMPKGGSGRVPEADVIRDYLLALDVAPQDIVLERTSTNTHEQAVNVARLLEPGERCLLVTVPTHMSRAMAVFRSQGLEPLAAPSGSVGAGEMAESEWWRDFVPNPYALRASEAALYERLGMTYYWMRGRL
jgi:uncharacterized SAM-binding protein YcdF (DUF218 family)